MITQPLNLEHLNLRGQQSYPLTEQATGRDVSGGMELPNTVLLGLSFPVDMSLGAASEKFHLASVTAFGDGVLFEFGYDGALIGSVMVTKANHTLGKSYLLTGLHPFESSIGILSVGDLDAVPLGRYEFDLDGGRLEVDCIRPQLPRVLSVQVENQGVLSPAITGPVAFRGGDNVQVTGSGGNPYTIRTDVVPGTTNPVSDCPCSDNVVQDTQPLHSINGLTGAITLRGVDCTKLEIGGNTVLFRDRCSQPCCGTPELEALLADVKTLNKAHASVTPTLSRLQAEMASLQQFVAITIINR